MYAYVFLFWFFSFISFFVCFVFVAVSLSPEKNCSVKMVINVMASSHTRIFSIHFLSTCSHSSSCLIVTKTLSHTYSSRFESWFSFCLWLLLRLRLLLMNSPFMFRFFFCLLQSFAFIYIYRTVWIFIFLYIYMYDACTLHAAQSETFKMYTHHIHQSNRSLQSDTVHTLFKGGPQRIQSSMDTHVI